MAMSDQELNDVIRKSKEERDANRATIDAGARALLKLGRARAGSPYREGQVISRRAIKIADQIFDLLKRVDSDG